jgi:dipeptidase
MHAGFGPVRISQSTASLVMYLDKTHPILFATGTSAPCTGIFKPFWTDAASFLNEEPAPTHQADSNSLYWSHEKLHRAVLENYHDRLAAYAPERDDMEKRFIAGALKLQNAPAQERAAFSQHCYAEARTAEADWLKRVEAIPAKRSFFHSMAWNGYNQKAGIGL